MTTYGMAVPQQLLGQQVKVIWTGKDRNKLTIGTVMLDGTNINHRLVAEGWAWQFKRYSSCPDLAQLEAEARSRKAVLWASETAPIPP